MPPKKNKAMIGGKFYPKVSICTPTYNRRPFIPYMFQMYKNQTYPKHRMEWIIVDDGSDKIEDLVKASGIENIKYISLPQKVKLGEKRNIMHKHCDGSIIVYMDDDDYYPPERVEHAVFKLQENDDVLAGGSSEMYIWFNDIQEMYKCGPYGPNHATAATFAFKRKLLDQTGYDNTAALAEEKAFLKDYTVPFVQFDAMKTILVVSHAHNSFDKHKLLENKHPDIFWESPKRINDFIRQPYESAVKEFFTTGLHEAIKDYAPGRPEHKPDVVEQIKEIEKKRDEMQRQMIANQPVFTIQDSNGGQKQISAQEMVNLFSDVQRQYQQAIQQIQMLEHIVKTQGEELMRLGSKPL